MVPSEVHPERIESSSPTCGGNMEPALTSAAFTALKALGNVFVAGHRRKIALDELQRRYVELMAAQAQAQVSSAVAHQRLLFLENVIASLIASGHFYREDNFLRLDAEFDSRQAGELIFGVVKECDERVEDKTQTETPIVVGSEKSPTPATAAELYFGGFREELKERRRRAGA
ncbi:hypothetical protein [Ornithinimicrobium sediminis]|uniref:hypothetical protein n=1 Tax=Ornithinimicrobium sediminis TaxID=2904603 RepID=UPI001E59BC55|nr:hypothetical protein [Ornithinimicrobium sediminis]MCE0485432.1 hypothetical protein [Ornithinimicrobium sediminis]